MDGLVLVQVVGSFWRVRRCWPAYDADDGDEADDEEAEDAADDAEKFCGGGGGHVIEVGVRHGHAAETEGDGERRHKYYGGDEQGTAGLRRRWWRRIGHVVCESDKCRRFRVR